MYFHLSGITIQSIAIFIVIIAINSTLNCLSSYYCYCLILAAANLHQNLIVFHLSSQEVSLNYLLNLNFCNLLSAIAREINLTPNLCSAFQDQTPSTSPSICNKSNNHKKTKQLRSS